MIHFLVLEFGWMVIKREELDVSYLGIWVAEWTPLPLPEIGNIWVDRESLESGIRMDIFCF